MNLESLLKLNRTIRVIGFDDAPFIRSSGEKVNLAGIICGGTRFEGMVWGELEQDGFDSTETICKLLLDSKFLPQLQVIDAMSRLPNLEKRQELIKRAGTIYEYLPFVFQVCGEDPEIIAKVLEKLTDCGKVPEALRLAHLISAAVIKGESGSSA